MRASAIGEIIQTDPGVLLLNGISNNRARRLAIGRVGAHPPVSLRRSFEAPFSHTGRAAGLDVAVLLHGKGFSRDRLYGGFSEIEGCVYRVPVEESRHSEVSRSERSNIFVEDFK